MKNYKKMYFDLLSKSSKIMDDNDRTITQLKLDCHDLKRELEEVKFKLKEKEKVSKVLAYAEKNYMMVPEHEEFEQYIKLLKIYNNMEET